MRNAFKSLLLTCITMLVGIVAFAQVTTSSMSGRVSDQTGPVVGATVLAVHQPTGSQFYAITDARGYYRLNSITSGGVTYNIDSETQLFDIRGYHYFVTKDPLEHI